MEDVCRSATSVGSLYSSIFLKDKNVECLRKNLTLEHILKEYSSKDIYILINNGEYNIHNNNNSSPVHTIFKELYDSDEGSSKFFIANVKTYTKIIYSTLPELQHYINGELVRKSEDDIKELLTSNLVKFDPVPKDERNDHLNEKVQLPCPQACPLIECNWKCIRCEKNIEYGHNNHVYCGCGKGNISHCKFRCNSSNHIKGFVPFESKPLEVNILLLGETGVGKSTFINTFINYLEFDTLDDAKAGDMEVIIPSEFAITNGNFETHTIKIGKEDSNEQLGNEGASSTMECKSYVFHAGNKLVRLIDTPGVGDTRGLDQDRKNFENILNFISNYKFLNGICILLKPNNSRLNVVFRFCIQELLSHLHKNAKDNIIFCFTSARGTSYNPGDTLIPLIKQIADLKERTKVEIKINKDTVYCFDNEAFRYLASIKNNVVFTQNDEKNFAESWKNSVDELKRLIEYLAKCHPHQVKDTLSLNNARNIVNILTQPLAEIEQLIQTNIRLIKEKQTEIENSDQVIEKLKKDKLYISQVDLEPVQLEHSRTVCTNNSCVNTFEINEVDRVVKKIDYSKHCCPKCYIPFVKHNVINSKLLLFCWSLKFGTCKFCGCEWDKHMHVTYENKKIPRKIIDQDVLSLISEKQSDQEVIKRTIIDVYDKRIDQQQNEREKIHDASIKFAQFLRQNALATFNDAYADYLDLFIKEEKIKKSDDPKYNNEILKGLEETKCYYLSQIETIKQAINDNNVCSYSPEDIAELEQQLYTLPINGLTLKKIKDEASFSHSNAFNNNENHYYLSRINNKRSEKKSLKIFKLVFFKDRYLAKFVT